MRRGVLPTMTTKRQSAAWVGETLPRPKKNAISEVLCEDHVGDFLRLARCNPQRICSRGWNYQSSVLQRRNGKAPKQNLTSLWLDFGYPESHDKYMKHHCKGRLLQRHPEGIWPCKSVCTVRRDVCRKLNNISVISFMQILFIMPVLKLSRRTVYISSELVAACRLLENQGSALL